MTYAARTAVAALLIAGFAISSPARAQKLEIWIRGFIPNDLPGTPDYVQPVPGDPGHWMIPGPGIPYVASGPLPWIGSCYNTNDRGFTADRAAESKVASVFTVEIGAGPTATSKVAPATPVKTRQFNCATGKVTCDKSVNLNKVSVSEPRIVGKTIEFDLDADAENACIPLVEWTPGIVVPSIKWHGKLTISPAQGRVSFSGTVAEFPAYEAYISVDGKDPVVLIAEMPSAGATVWSLAKNRKIDVSAAYYSLDGIWQSSDAAKRFRLSCAKTQCEWSETQGGRMLNRTAALEVLPGNAGYRLRRANADPELLTFLGFSPAVQAEMMARNPQASFIDLSFDKGKLNAAWSGILVIKDNQGKFVEMKQPGTTPAKPYVFQRL